MNRTKWFFRPTFYIVMVLLFAWGYTTLGYGDRWAAFFYPEDHFFENTQPTTLMLACILALYMLFRTYKNRQVLKPHWLKLLVYLGLAGIFFFVAGEEISWGQRIFHIQTPASIAAINTQHETNIHNLAIFEKNGFITFDNIFTMFWMGFAVIIPFGSLLWRRFRQFAEKYTPIGYWGIGILFLVNYVFAKAAKLIYHSVYTFQMIPFPQAVKEVKESNYDLLFVFLSIILLWELNRQIHEKTELVPEVGTLGTANAT